MPAYKVVDAARYAKVTSQTILNWQKASGTAQAIGPRETGVSLSYLQLVELAFVSTLRDAGVKLRDIKEAREYMGQQLRSEFPFAEHRFMTDGKNLWKSLADFDAKQSKNAVVKLNKGGQLAWKNFVEDKFTEFKYEKGIAVQWRVAGPDSPVVIDPRVSFGAPMVKGVATWAIKGRYEAGESLEDIAEDFALMTDDVNSALAFEGIDISKLKAWH